MALVVYSLLPILKNTYTAVSNVDENIIDAAKDLGMNRSGKNLKKNLLNFLIKLEIAK